MDNITNALRVANGKNGWQNGVPNGVKMESQMECENGAPDPVKFPMRSTIQWIPPYLIGVIAIVP